jgi:uncharacterized membrane protein YadS
MILALSSTASQQYTMSSDSQKTIPVLAISFLSFCFGNTYFQVSTRAVAKGNTDVNVWVLLLQDHLTLHINVSFFTGEHFK